MSPKHDPSAAAGFAIAIMAAGKGTRLKSRHPKVLHQVGGKPLLEYVVRAALEVAPAQDIFAIIGNQAERVRQAVSASGINFVEQAEQRGTGHAIQCARRQLAAYADVLVLSGDVPGIRPETLRRLMEHHLRRRAAMTILTAKAEDPTGYGRVIRKRGDQVAGIVEERSLRPGQARLREINSGIYAFATRELLRQIDKLTPDNPHHELYLTDVAALLVKAGKPVLAVRAEKSAEVLGANTLAELAELDARLRREKSLALMAAGVTILRPETCVIDAGVTVGPDTLIEPYVQLYGRTRIGEDCRIRSFSIISDSELAAGVQVRPGCVIDSSRIAARAVVGPFSHLRPGSEIGEEAHVGNFVEVKKTRLGRRSKANHLTYLGDAEIGEDVNVGAGTITCNYDGTRKHTTIIEDGAFIGSDSTLVAPVRVGQGAYVGAGSTITDPVPPDALALGRARQTVKEGWARQRRAERAASKQK